MKYNTSDIVLAATFVSKGIKVSKITVDGHKGTFYFDDPTVTPDLITEYELDKITVSPVLFNNCIKRLTTSVRRMINPN